ncbi:MAG: ABC transporter permease [Deltaproteobacteria bacterium]|nr:ABC transporter permease [Deltaproteobacteria bacterium]MCW5803747.1 ABC transporter permease [Deltaproteobacteria bacterium]
MIGLVARRVAWAVLVAWFAATAAFAVVALVPADPVKALLGPHATPDAIERARAHYCLDEGVAGRYACWIGNAARGDLGESYRTRRPVGELLADRIWPTAQLALAAIFLQLAIGVPLGVFAARRRGRWPDRAVSFAGLVAQSAPPFVVGTALVYLLAYRFDVFPTSGYGEGVLDRLRHLVLPALTLATAGVAYYARVVRSELADTLAEDYVRTARAKGLPERTVVLRHALRPALGPLLALIGLDLGVLLGGAVVVEAIFAWPGLGREVLQAVVEVDTPLVVAVVFLASLAIAAANLVVDLAMFWIDPRVRR